jgi:putative membrane protein
MFLAQAGNSFRRTSSVHSYCLSGHSNNKSAFLPFVVTLLMAFLLPNNTLDAGMAYNKGMNLGTPPATSGQYSPPPAVPDNMPTTQTDNNNANNQGYASQTRNPVQSKIDELQKTSLIKVNEDNFTLVTNQVNIYPEQYVGKEITMLGFVLKEKKFPSNQFGLARYVITCCSADAMPDGFICEYKNASHFSEGDWLNIRGNIQLGKYEGNTVPIIKVTSFSKVQEPQNPYIYPVYY